MRIGDGVYAEVARYANERQRVSQDLYGWAVLADDIPTVLFYVSHEAHLETFPEEIGKVRVKLKRVSPPRPQSLGFARSAV